MGRATDLASLQFRMLNRSKGPAVWSPRAQCDRSLYRRAVRSLIEECPTLQTIQGTVARLIMDQAGATVLGAETLEGRRFGARCVVITAGTFLRGRIHIGTDLSVSGGRAGESATTHLADQLERAGLHAERFKTGTPPRIDGRSVNFSQLQVQESEIDQFDYSWSHFWPEPRLNSGCDTSSGSTAMLDHLPGSSRQADHRRQYRPLRNVWRRNRCSRAALLPIRRRQDLPVPERVTASDIPRARGPRHERAVRQRTLHIVTR